MQYAATRTGLHARRVAPRKINLIQIQDFQLSLGAWCAGLTEKVLNMTKHIEITVTADVPENQEELGHEAIVNTKDHVQTLTDALRAMGLTNAVGTRRIGWKRGRKTELLA